MRALIVLLVALSLCGCMRLGMDDTSGGGGSWAVETYHPCYPPKPMPVGGNAGNAQNEDTIGGGVGVDKQP